MKDKIVIIEDDITELQADAIVCPANMELEMTGAISEQLLDKGGDKIQNECNTLKKPNKGDALLTNAGTLKVKYLIHAIIESGEDSESNEEDLMLAIRNALNLAKEKGLKAIALPLITNIDIPIKRAAELMLAEAKKHLEIETCLQEILFVAENGLVYNAFDEAYRQL